MSSTHTETNAAHRPELAAAVARELSLPLSALRIAVQGMLERREADGELCDQLDSLLDELARVEHGVEGLIDLVAPPRQHADRCPLREIARCAWSALPSRRRDQVRLALETTPDTCHVDGPQFERALSMLLMEATEDPNAEVLLHAHADGSAAHFELIGGGTSQRLDLDGAVARRSLERFGAEVVEHGGTDRPTRVHVRVPLGGAA